VFLTAHESLADFIQKAPKKGPKSWLVSIPEYEEIVAAWLAGANPSLITEWLKQRGYPATISSVDPHLRRHHPR
jgi:hypothetical protein